MRQKITYITRKEHFNAAHKLCNPKWSNEQNEVVFGKCANANWHGHNFDLFVTVKGVAHPDTGFVVDIKKLKTIIKENIIQELDHKNLNLDVPFLEGIMPSIENLIVIIWERLEPKLPAGCILHKITLYETPNNFVEYFGE
jgi:6-pyruvoyltetrahydropterin/6-carboxytetrahydropterin synthase